MQLKVDIAQSGEDQPSVIFFDRVFAYSGLNNKIRSMLGLTRTLSHQHASLFDLVRWSLWLDSPTRQSLEDACSEIMFRNATSNHRSDGPAIKLAGAGLAFSVESHGEDRFSLSVNETSQIGDLPLVNPLTGLPNGHLLRARLACLLDPPSGVALRQARQASLHVVEIRTLKDDAADEDVLAHPSFHQTLMNAVAARIQSNKRLFDFLACIGPTRFGIIQTEADSDAKSDAFKSRLYTILSEPYVLETGPPIITSIGLTWKSYPVRGTPPWEEGIPEEVEAGTDRNLGWSN